MGHPLHQKLNNKSFLLLSKIILAVLNNLCKMLIWKLKCQSVIAQTQNCIQFYFEEILFFDIVEIVFKVQQNFFSGIYFWVCLHFWLNAGISRSKMTHTNLQQNRKQCLYILHMFEAWRFKNKPNRYNLFTYGFSILALQGVPI